MSDLIVQNFRFYISYVCNALKIKKKIMFDYLARIRHVLTLREVE